MSKGPDTGSFYIEGVGFGGKKIGSGTGWGMDYRVVKAYAYLLDNYRPGDRIYLFGFSRGAYGARILAALLYHAGIPDPAPALDGCRPVEGGGREPERHECLFLIGSDIYAAYKGIKDPVRRRQDVTDALALRGLHRSAGVDVEFLGLWDTVEALGMVDTVEAIRWNLGMRVDHGVEERNKRYGDQLCNVRRARHAVSIDDNRAHVFTPRLLTVPHLLANCLDGDADRYGRDPDQVREVWFAGSHSDVGGGEVPDSLSNTSLNWMISELGDANAVLGFAALADTPHAPSHDGRSGALIYREKKRKVAEWAAAGQWPNGRRQIHCTVIERLAKTAGFKDHEYGWDDRPAACFTVANGSLLYKGSATPAQACTDRGLQQQYPGCWFEVANQQPAPLPPTSQASTHP